MEAVVAPKIAECMWWKLVDVCGASIFCLMRANKGQVWHFAETPALVRQVVAEGVAVAQARGIALAPTLPDEAVAVFDNVPPQYKPSLLVDLEHGRRLEIERVEWGASTLWQGSRCADSSE